MYRDPHLSELSNSSEPHLASEISFSKRSIATKTLCYPKERQ